MTFPSERFMKAVETFGDQLRAELDAQLSRGAQLKEVAEATILKLADQASYVVTTSELLGAMLYLKLDTTWLHAAVLNEWYEASPLAMPAKTFVVAPLRQWLTMRKVAAAYGMHL